MYKYIRYFQRHWLTHKSVDEELYPISKNYRVILFEKKRENSVMQFEDHVWNFQRILFETFNEPCQDFNQLF